MSSQDSNALASGLRVQEAFVANLDTHGGA